MLSSWLGTHCLERSLERSTATAAHHQQKQQQKLYWLGNLRADAPLACSLLGPFFFEGVGPADLVRRLPDVHSALKYMQVDNGGGPGSDLHSLEWYVSIGHGDRDPLHSEGVKKQMDSAFMAETRVEHEAKHEADAQTVRKIMPAVLNQLFTSHTVKSCLSEASNTGQETTFLKRPLVSRGESPLATLQKRPNADLTLLVCDVWIYSIWCLFAFERALERPLVSPGALLKATLEPAEQSTLKSHFSNSGQDGLFLKRPLVPCGELQSEAKRSSVTLKPGAQHGSPQWLCETLDEAILSWKQHKPASQYDADCTWRSIIELSCQLLAIDCAAWWTWNDRYFFSKLHARADLLPVLDTLEEYGRLWLQKTQRSVLWMLALCSWCLATRLGLLGMSGDAAETLFTTFEEVKDSTVATSTSSRSIVSTESSCLKAATSDTRKRKVADCQNSSQTSISKRLCNQDAFFRNASVLEKAFGKVVLSWNLDEWSVDHILLLRRRMQLLISRQRHSRERTVIRDVLQQLAQYAGGDGQQPLLVALERHQLLNGSAAHNQSIANHTSLFTQLKAAVPFCFSALREIPPVASVALSASLSSCASFPTPLLSMVTMPAWLRVDIDAAPPALLSLWSDLRPFVPLTDTYDAAPWCVATQAELLVPFGITDTFYALVRPVVIVPVGEHGSGSGKAGGGGKDDTRRVILPERHIALVSRGLIAASIASMCSLSLPKRRMRASSNALPAPPSLAVRAKTTATLLHIAPWLTTLPLRTIANRGDWWKSLHLLQSLRTWHGVRSAWSLSLVEQHQILLPLELAGQQQHHQQQQHQQLPKHFVLFRDRVTPIANLSAFGLLTARDLDRRLDASPNQLDCVLPLLVCDFIHLLSLQHVAPTVLLSQACLSAPKALYVTQHTAAASRVSIQKREEGNNDVDDMGQRVFAFLQTLPVENRPIYRSAGPDLCQLPSCRLLITEDGSLDSPWVLPHTQPLTAWDKVHRARIKQQHQSANSAGSPLSSLVDRIGLHLGLSMSLLQRIAAMLVGRGKYLWHLECQLGGTYYDTLAFSTVVDSVLTSICGSTAVVKDRSTMVHNVSHALVDLLSSVP